MLNNGWLVVYLFLWKNDGVSNSWDDDIPFPRWWKKVINVIIQPLIQPCSSHHQPEYHVISNPNICPILIQPCSSYTPNKFFRCGPQEVFFRLHETTKTSDPPANHQFPLTFPGSTNPWNPKTQSTQSKQPPDVGPTLTCAKGAGGCWSPR